MDIADTIVVQLAVVSDVMLSGTGTLQRSVMTLPRVNGSVYVENTTKVSWMLSCLLLRTVS